MRIFRSGVIGCVCACILVITGAAWGVEDGRATSPLTIRVYHSDVEFASDDTSVSTLHAEFRANNEAGIEGASRRTVSYDSLMERVEILEAHTLKADGRIIPVAPAAVFDRDFADDGLVLSGRREKVILFPQFEAGDTAVYTVKETVHAARYPGTITYGRVWDPTAQVDDMRETVKVPASLVIKSETHGMEMTRETAGGFTTYTWRYSAHNTKPREIVPVSPLMNRPRYFLSSFENFEAVAAAYAATAAPKLTVTPAIAALADEITKGERARLKQAQKLYEWVASHIRYVAIELGNGSIVPHEAQAVLANGYGDCKDHDALFQTLLKAKGIKAETALINLGREYNLTEVPNSATLNHAITYLPEFDLYVDSTAAVAPFGVLPFEEYGKPVLRASTSRSLRTATPVLKSGATSMETLTDETLESNGVLHGTTKSRASGPRSIWLRQRGLGILRSRPVQAAADELSRNGYDHGSGTFDAGSPKSVTPDYEVTGEFRAEGWNEKLKGKPFALPRGLALLAPPGDGPMGQLMPGQLKDDEPTVCFSDHQIEKVSLHIPPQLRMAELPKDMTVETPNLRFTARWTYTNNTLSVSREFTSRIDAPICSGKVREEAAAALKKIREHYRAQLSVVPAEISSASQSNP